MIDESSRSICKHDFERFEWRRGMKRVNFFMVHGRPRYSSNKMGAKLGYGLAACGLGFGRGDSRCPPSQSPKSKKLM